MSWIDSALNFMGTTWLGTLLTIVGLFGALVTYLWTRKRTSLSYVHLGEHLLGSASDALPPSIVVQYDGMSIPRLTKSVLILWNSGENTVKGDEIVAKDPLRFHVGGDGQILSISVLKTSRSVNDFSLTPSGKSINEAEFNFDFLDANDGVVVEILHTSTDRRPRVKGTLRGLPQGFRNLGQFTRPKPQKKKKGGPLSVLATIVFSPIVLACAGFLFAIYGPHPPSPPGDSSFFNGLMGGLGAFFALTLIRSWTTRRKYPRSLHLEVLE